MRRRHRRLPSGLTSAALALLVGSTTLAVQSTRDPLGRFSTARRTAIASGSPVIEVLPSEGRDFGVAGAVRTKAAPGRLVEQARQVERFYGGKYAPFIERFSAVPRLSDVATLVFDDEDLEDLRECRPGRCGLKLSAGEMQQVAATLDRAGSAWKAAAQEAFRRIVVARAAAYLTGGRDAQEPYEDHREPVSPVREFDLLLERFRGDPLFTPRIEAEFRRRSAPQSDGDSVLYWSKDQLGDAKPIVSITHLRAFPAEAGEPAVLAAFQVYASHYLNASLSLTAIADAGSPPSRYLLYSRWSRIDVFERRFGWLIRRTVRGRVARDGPAALDALRRKLETGHDLPPAGLR